MPGNAVAQLGGAGFLCRMHGFIRWVARRGLKWVFRDVVVVGAEQIPADGPVLMVGNHPNDLPDVLAGYLLTPREVHYVATMAAGTSPLARAVFRGLGVIPVTRIRDARRLLQQGANVAELNRVAYRRVQDAWGDGELVAIFPEGGVWGGPDLGPFRLGAAKMLGQCLHDGTCNAMSVASVGYQYEHHDQHGSDVFVQVSSPLTLGREDVSPSPDIAAPRVTTALSEQVRKLVRYAHTVAERQTLNSVIAAMGAAVTSHPDDALLTAGTIGPRVSELWRHDAIVVHEVVGIVGELEPLARMCGARPESARDLAVLRWAANNEKSRNTPRTRLSWLQRASMPAVLFTAPVAAIGWILHAPVFALVWALAIRHAEGPEHRVARAMLPGIYIVLAWLLVSCSALAIGLSLLERSPWFALLMVPLFFLLGDIAAEWRHALRLQRLRFRARRMTQTQKHTLQSCMERIGALVVKHVDLSVLHGTEGKTVRVLA